MITPELLEILEALEKPLLYASRNDYANLKTLKGVEPYMVRWVEKAGSLPLSRHQQELFRRLKVQLPGFDGLDLPSKKARLLELAKIMEEFKMEEFPAPAVEAWPTPAEFHQHRKDLQTPIQYIKGVGPRLSEILKKKNIRTVEDALYFLPRAYEDRRNIKTISRLTVGRLETVIGTVLQAGMSYYGRRRTFELLVGDDTGTLVAKWFNFNPRFMKGKFRNGMRLILSGEIRMFNFQKEIHHPELEIIEQDEKQETEKNFRAEREFFHGSLRLGFWGHETYRANDLSY